jgi:transposase
MLFDAAKSSISSLEFVLPEVTLPSVLPTDSAELTALLYAQHQAYKEVTRKALSHIQHLFEQFILSRHRQFGSSSEQSSAQRHLFDEAEMLVDATEAQDTAAPEASDADKDKPGNKPVRGKRGPLPANLKRVDIVHEAPESERTCPCGAPMVEIGQDVSEQLDIVPMQVRVLRHIRKRYGCPAKTHAPITAPLPPQPLPKSNASADFLAMLLTVKFVDGLPLTRFGKVLDRCGVPVPIQTLARWVIGTGHVIQPLLNLMRDALLDGSLIHIDETVVQVLKEKGKKPTANSYMWVQTGGPPGKPVVIYDYDPGRGGDVPVRLLHDYRGYLMADGYDGYNKLAKIEGIERLACWAHVRRRYVDAVKVQPKGKRSRADEALAMIGRLYRIERDYKDTTDDVRLLARQQLSVPVLAELHAWMEKTLPAITPKSALGAALSYMHDGWNLLTRYTERGDLPIDNNRCENAIRPFVLGRRAWLFSDTPAGAHASAVIYSFVETAKANGLEPYAWLRCVLRALPAAKTVEDIEALLPWNFNSAQAVSQTVPICAESMGEVL